MSVQMIGQSKGRSLLVMFFYRFWFFINTIMNICTHANSVLFCAYREKLDLVTMTQIFDVVSIIFYVITNGLLGTNVTVRTWPHKTHRANGPSNVSTMSHGMTKKLLIFCTDCKNEKYCKPKACLNGSWSNTIISSMSSEDFTCNSLTMCCPRKPFPPVTTTFTEFLVVEAIVILSRKFADHKWS